MMTFQNPNEFWSKIAAADGLSRCFLLIPEMMSSIPATHKERMEPMRTRRIWLGRIATYLRFTGKILIFQTSLDLGKPRLMDTSAFDFCPKLPDWWLRTWPIFKDHFYFSTSLLLPRCGAALPLLRWTSWKACCIGAKRLAKCLQGLASTSAASPQTCQKCPGPDKNVADFSKTLTSGKTVSQWWPSCQPLCRFCHRCQSVHCLPRKNVQEVNPKKETPNDSYLLSCKVRCFWDLLSS